LYFQDKLSQRQGERERERDRDGDRKRETEAERERQRQNERERHCFKGATVIREIAKISISCVYFSQHTKAITISVSINPSSVVV